MDRVALHLPSRRATRHLGAALAPALRRGDRLWLEGPLGGGKTFFARGLLRALGVPEDLPVTSPTFALVHEYAGRLPILHLDLYRLAAPEELDELGLLDAVERAVVVAEWGAAFRDALGAGGLEIAFERPADRGREVTVRALDGRGEVLLAACVADRRIAPLLRC